MRNRVEARAHIPLFLFIFGKYSASARWRVQSAPCSSGYPQQIWAWKLNRIVTFPQRKHSLLSIYLQCGLSFSSEVAICYYLLYHFVWRTSKCRVLGSLGPFQPASESLTKERPTVSIHSVLLSKIGTRNLHNSIYVTYGLIPQNQVLAYFPEVRNIVQIQYCVLS